MPTGNGLRIWQLMLVGIFLKNRPKYTEDGNFPASSTDSRGYETKYQYNQRGLLLKLDPDGEAVANIVGGIIGGVAGAALGDLLSDALELKGWIGADQLNRGNTVILYGGYQAVEEVTIEYLQTSVKVYNFEVEDFHTYYVGENSILVHNKGCGLNKLADSYIKKPLKLNAHSIKQEYLGRKTKISLYDLAVDKKTGIIYIVDKAGKIVTDTIYKTK